MSAGKTGRTIGGRRLVEVDHLRQAVVVHLALLWLPLGAAFDDTSVAWHTVPPVDGPGQRQQRHGDRLHVEDGTCAWKDALDARCLCHRARA